MAEFPALPLFTDALIADTGHLSDDEFGLYLRILILMWRSPDCKIPANADWLEKRLRRPIAAIGVLLAEFCQTDGNFYTQKRLLKEFFWVRKNSKKQSVNAKSRYNKEKHPSQTPAKTLPNACQIDAPHPTPPIPTIEEANASSPPTPKAKKSKSVVVTEPWPDWVPVQAMNDYIENRKVIKKPMSPTAIKLCIKKLQKLCADGSDPEEILNQSTFAGWQGLFPLTNGDRNAKQSRPLPPSYADATAAGFDTAADLIQMARDRQRGGE